jgi:hypothetical protein
MSKFKSTLILLVRLGLAFIAMLVVYMLSLQVVGQTDITLSPEEARQAGIALIFVSLLYSLILSFIILRSPWYGLKLIGAVFLVQFGVETFMAQIETLYFNRAVQMSTAVFISIVAAGALRALIFAPLAVLIFGKLKKSAQPEEEPVFAVSSDFGKRFLAVTLIYVLIYFLFGYFVAWQWEETRLYYSGSTAIKPFFVHFRDLFLTEDPFILPFQLLRGALWTLLALLIIRMMIAKRWEKSLAVAFTFAVLFSLPLGLFPNPIMPPPVARSHFIEISTSMLLFGAIAGWVLYSKGRIPQPS